MATFDKIIALFVVPAAAYVYWQWDVVVSNLGLFAVVAVGAWLLGVVCRGVFNAERMVTWKERVENADRDRQATRTAFNDVNEKHQIEVKAAETLRVKLHELETLIADRAPLTALAQMSGAAQGAMTALSIANTNTTASITVTVRLISGPQSQG